MGTADLPLRLKRPGFMKCHFFQSLFGEYIFNLRSYRNAAILVIYGWVFFLESKFCTIFYIFNGPIRDKDV